MKNTHNRWLSLLLCSVLAFSLPANTLLAEETDMQTEKYSTVTTLTSETDTVSSLNESLPYSDGQEINLGNEEIDEFSSEYDASLFQEEFTMEDVPDTPSDIAPPKPSASLLIEDFASDDLLGSAAMGAVLSPSNDKSFFTLDESMLGEHFDPNQLFESYALRELGLTSDADFAHSFCGDNLTGTDAKVYKELKKHIEKIADGSVKDTLVTIPMYEAGFPKRLYGSDFGAGKITVNPFDLSEAAYGQLIEKLMDYFSYSPITVGWSVVRDCPYEFYWFDLTFSYNEPYAATFEYDSTRKEYYIDYDFCFDFVVNEEFRGGTEYDLNTSKTSLVQKALTNAQAIVDKASSLSDYEKLCYYRDVIVSLTDYNYDAAYRNAESGYGYDSNPWQILWVFDGDPSTEVVCEGYAKSFKYLCDQTSFSHANIQCYWAKGLFGSEPGGDAHSWNVVHMSDGRNYLVDLTNCDRGGDVMDLCYFMAVPLSGSVSEGYCIMTEEGEYYYEYDEETQSFISHDLLALSETPFDPNQLELPQLSKPVLSKVKNTSSGVQLTWESVDGAEKYRIFRKTSDDSWKRIGSTTNISFVDTNVVSGTPYVYTVRCTDITDSVYTSGYDKAGLKTTFIAAPVLSDITNVYYGVSLSWKASKGASYYRILRKTPGGTWEKLALTTKTKYTDKTAVSGKKYLYTVRCVNKKKSSFTSGYDTTGLGITFIAPPKLTEIKNTAAGITVTWKASKGAVRYKVFRKTGSGSWKTVGFTTATSYTDKTAVSGKKYTYSVRCVDRTGKKNISSYSSKGISITKK